MSKFKMTVSLNIINHLGLSLYSNTPSVLSEIVANSYDADAKVVRITTDDEDGDQIIIIDDGNGMSIEEINERFLKVGYQKRKEKNKGLSEVFNRPVMGRKGIGKLSLFSIAKVVEIHTKKQGENGQAFKMNLDDIQELIGDKDNTREYNPIEIDFDSEGIEDSGTKIIISKIDKNISKAATYLRKRLARRFSLKDPLGGFDIFINDEIVKKEDLDYYKNFEFIWPIGNFELPFKSSGVTQASLDGIIEGGIEIKGWIASVTTPSVLKLENNENNNKISIMCRGKLAQEDILSSFNEGGIYASYLIGEIHADFLDLDEEKDIATSNRQELNQNDERFKSLTTKVNKLLKKIQSTWTNLRNEKATDKAIIQMPILEEWFESQIGDEKKYAKKLFQTIESLGIEDVDIDKKKELYRYGILSFEKLKHQRKLSELEHLKIENIIEFGKLFTELQDIEATMYYDIARQRVDIIKKLRDAIDENAKEQVLQQHLFENLWLLNPSWERATKGTEFIEQNVQKAFKEITVKLTEEEKKGRFDIRYRSSSDKHIIIELKRYNASYKFDEHDLARQIGKYSSALRKCLEASEIKNPFIESICIVGKNAINDMNEANEYLKVKNARVICYDQLINDSLVGYESYVESVGKIDKISTIVNGLFEKNN
ncbi:ATP-binding protein [Myroides odoratimimus]|uniref:BbrUII/HgiDII family restriction enzyme n=1 Tax=Myroides odoratimimus TaxID=76832 RepID=UPI0025782B30|nr:ATP-binding protein [Myroides odoratimimus]MDM1396080.1 ATP-binding protein [Myroides odoratimimus]